MRRLLSDPPYGINETVGIPGIGKGKRWILNLRNADDTRVEFTEAHTVK